MAKYIVIFEGKAYSAAATLEEAAQLFDNYARRSDLRGSTYLGTIVVDAATREVLVYISMNGRVWTRATGHGTTPDKLNWDLEAERRWNDWVAQLPAA